MSFRRPFAVMSSKMEVFGSGARTMRPFVLFLDVAGSAMAGLIITADPSTSAAYPVGTSFEPGEVSATTDPVGPFSDIPIQFKGYSNGGSQVSWQMGSGVQPATAGKPKMEIPVKRVCWFVMGPRSRKIDSGNRVVQIQLIGKGIRCV